MTDLKSKIFYLQREQEEKHTEELAKKLNLPYINLAKYPITDDVLSLIPENLAIEHQIIPYLKIGKTIKLGVVKPNNPKLAATLKQLEKTIGVTFAITVISHTGFIYGIYLYEKIKKKKATLKKEIEIKKEESVEDQIKDIKSAAEVLKRATTTKLLDTLIVGGINVQASDVHIEPSEDDFLIRYRIDGILQDVVRLPFAQYKQLVSRLKYMANMRMDLAGQPQDGRMTLKTFSEEVDLRISTMPSTWGDSVVIRLLGQEKSIITLDSLGVRADAMAAIKTAISKPYGMILTSGPTGSGKTTTLYAIVMELKKPGIKIITLENPIEYRISGIEQSQINVDTGYDFATALKASLRQDPDILMVGEIRDSETGETAVQAALTGHLLISTIHANSAPAVFARLLEMGVKPFLISGSINLIMAQRLVRRVCTHCKERYTPRPEIWQEIKGVLLPIIKRLSPELQKILTLTEPSLAKGKGCKYCSGSGFLGRGLIIEVLVPDENIESLIAKKATISEFKKAAVVQGMVTMEQDGLIKALEGLTTCEEVWRVTRG